MGARSRRKGAQWERDVARMFSELLGEEVQRGISQTRGAVEPDVDLPGWWVECKVSIRPPNVWAAMRQAVRDSEECAGPARTPVVFARHNGGGGKPATDLVVMRREDWLVMFDMLPTVGVLFEENARKADPFYCEDCDGYCRQ